MSPSDIDVLLHCYYSPNQHPRFHALAVMDAIKTFVEEGLIEKDVEASSDSHAFIYRCTSRGVAHVMQLCNLPLPKQVWVDAHGEMIKEQY